MKKIILFAFTTVLLLPKTYANDACFESLNSHIDVIEKSEEFIGALKAHSSTISSYEIIQLQKNLTNRYSSLNNLIAVYEKNAECSPKAYGKAVAVYDFSKIGESIFADKYLRRAVLNFIKYKPYNLSNFKKDYEHYTTHEVINEIEYELQAAHTLIPASIGALKRPKYDRDPNLAAPSDLAIKGTAGIVAGAARTWGFISDRLKWRNGRLNKDVEAITLMRANLKPLDLIYETREFTLSNYTIPGHWGHVGIWLGTKEELIALGVWDQEFFAPFKKSVEEGKQIFEIRKEGAVFQALETFMNLDETAINRVEGIELNAHNVFSELSTNIGKKYDFKFDSRSADKITCAELITFSYGDYKWHETKTLFQNSLSPDDLAISTLDPNSSVKFVLYLKGNKEEKFASNNFEEWKNLFKTK